MEIIGFILAALVGVSLGLVGSGGSILTVPILVYLMGVNPVLATSYSLFIVGSTSLVGAINNHRKGLVSIKTALLFGLSSIATVYLTRKWLLPQLPTVFYLNQHFSITQATLTMVLFAILMLMASSAMISNKQVKHLAISVVQREINWIQLLAYGVLIGLVTGFLGAGGGFLIIPILVLVFQMPMKKAVGTSLLIIALNSLIGFTGDLGHFNMDWQLLITLTLIAVSGIFMGGFLSKKIAGAKLEKAFGWFVLLMAIYILAKELF